VSILDIAPPGMDNERVAGPGRDFGPIALTSVPRVYKQGVQTIRSPLGSVRGSTPMLWRLWQQHRADRAEARALRTYAERSVAYRALCDLIVEARRRADVRCRLDAALASQHDASGGVRPAITTDAVVERR
jgi:hypothetical protein